jgi:hypothetical protein
MGGGGEMNLSSKWLSEIDSTFLASCKVTRYPWAFGHYVFKTMNHNNYFTYPWASIHYVFVGNQAKTRFWVCGIQLFFWVFAFASSLCSNGQHSL